jgi:hypothetical protein
VNYKSRITPQGFRFRPGVDYDPAEVTADTPHMQTVMLGLAIEVNLNLHVIHADADNCFNAYSKLPDDARITLKTPKGMNLPPGQTLLLVNAIQGSPQAGRIWQDLANEFLLTALHFSQSAIDPCYYWQRAQGSFVQVIRLVDDFRIGAEDLAVAENIYAQLAAKWNFKRQINKPWCGMFIVHDRENGTLTISMKQELETMLERFGMQDCTPIATPADPGSKLAKPLTPIVDSPFDYRGAVGCLLWFARTGRPEISYAVNQVSQFVTCYDDTHITATKRILRYFKGTLDLKKILRRSDGFHHMAYVDSDFGGEPESNEFPMRSLSALVVMLVGVGAILASVILEKTLSLSTCEAEYKAIARGAQVLVGHRQFMDEIGFGDSKPSQMYSDNQAAIAMTQQASSHAATRHMKMKFHYIREQIANREVTLGHCPTLQMIADILTKALERGLFEKFRRVLLSGIDENGQVY